MLHPILNDVTTFKNVAPEENALILFNSFSCMKKQANLAINIVMVQIVISITSSPSGTGFYVMRWVKYGGW